MNKVIGVAVLAAVIGGVVFYVRRSETPGQQAGQNATVPPNVQSFTDPAAKPTVPARRAAPAPARQSSVPPPPAPRTIISGEPIVDNAPRRTAGRAGAVPTVVTAPPNARRDVFLAGNADRWTPIRVDVTAGVLVQAGGRLSVGGDNAGPGGLRRELVRGPLALDDLVLPTAPYLALVGRVCSSDKCSDPFVIGTRATVCAATLGVAGSLELWTNNRVREGEAATRNNFSAALGGYQVYVEPAPESACDRSAPVTAYASEDATLLNGGGTLDRPEFVISSSQRGWKPFFLPLDRPLRIRATGAMRPAPTASPTGPEGIVVPAGPTWRYPGTQVIVDADHPLFEPSTPYQALIGRVCGPSACGPIFVVGRDQTICAPTGYQDRLELWINHVVPSESVLSRNTSLTMATFDFQTRYGAYQFTVAPGSESACVP